MAQQTLRNRIATGVFTLPVTVVLSIAVWLLPDTGNLHTWAGLCFSGLLTYLLMELVNRNQLLRIRSRMISTTFVLWLAASPFLHSWHAGMLPALTLLLSMFLLFSSYQKEHAEREIFYAFFLHTLGWLVFPPLVVLFPVFYVAMGVHLRSLTWRTLGASLLGVLLPLWFGTAGLFWFGQTGRAATYFGPWLSFELPDYRALSLSFWLNAGFLVWQFLLGLLHYYRTNFNDKIRVRMCFYVFILADIVLLILLFLYPDHATTLFLLAILFASPLVGHYYALARGRGWMTFWFLLNVLLLMALGVFNYFFA